MCHGLASTDLYLSSPAEISPGELLDTAAYLSVFAKTNPNYTHMPMGVLDTDARFRYVHVSVSAPTAVLHADRVGCNIRILDHLQSTRGKKSLIYPISNAEPRQDTKLPIGPDCTKYISMEIKLNSAGRSRGLVSIDSEVKIGVGLASSVLVSVGLLAALLAHRRYRGVFHMDIGNSVSMHRISR
jgi:hypothetical protein